jgi:hypothetical protein
LLTVAQLQALKADIAANTNTVNGVAIKDMPLNDDANFAIAAWYSALASPDFFVFRSDVNTSEIFDQVTWANFTPSDAPDNTVTWSNRSLACQGKQFNLQILLQGQASFNAGRITQRAGLNDATTNLPSGTGGQSRSGGWSTILAILRRKALRIEKLFATQTSGVGVLNTDALGATTNPALLAVEGAIDFNTIGQARAS